MTGIYSPGIYIVEVRAWADNNIDTGAFEELLINVVDPCVSANLAIDDSVLKTLPQATMTQYIGYESISVVWDDSIVTSTISEPNLCGPLTHSLSVPSGGIPDPAIFSTNDLTLPDKTLNVQSSDFADVGAYSIVLTVNYSAYVDR